MLNIDEICLSGHPDPRMREVAAQAPQIRSRLWAIVLRRSLRGAMTALDWIWCTAADRLARPRRHAHDGPDTSNLAVKQRIGSCG
jgi:hypothetical protein